jgi:hypothetical protein
MPRLPRVVRKPGNVNVPGFPGFRPAARTGESAGGMAADLRHTQPAETLPLRMEPPECLKDLTQPTPFLSWTAWPVPTAPHPVRGERESAKSEIVGSYLRRAPSGRHDTVDGAAHHTLGATAFAPLGLAPLQIGMGVPVEITVTWARGFRPGVTWQASAT